MDVALLGCGCSAATEAVAEIVQYWSLPQVCINHCMSMQACRQGGFEGNPPFGPQKF